MRYFLDTEFIERPSFIDLISIGIAADDGRELYAINAECDLKNANRFVVENVLNTMPMYDARRMKWRKDCLRDNRLCRGLFFRFEIAMWIIDFVGKDPDPQFWGYYSSYDWVAFCWLFGPMVKLPSGFPMYCRDLKMLADMFGCELPKQDARDEHHALSDARWIKGSFEWMMDNVPRSRVILTGGRM